MNSKPGTYALVLSSRSRKSIRVGKLGKIEVEPGYYVYVGSAFGPGGLKARVGRHARITKASRWHIDYLRPYLQLEEAWLTNDAKKREHCWADLFGESRGARIPLAGFGSSDCRCKAHLFYFRRQPMISTFRDKIALAFSDHCSILQKKFV